MSLIRSAVASPGSASASAEPSRLFNPAADASAADFSDADYDEDGNLIYRDGGDGGGGGGDEYDDQDYDNDDAASGIAWHDRHQHYEDGTYEASLTRDDHDNFHVDEREQSVSRSTAGGAAYRPSQLRGLHKPHQLSQASSQLPTQPARHNALSMSQAATNGHRSGSHHQREQTMYTELNVTHGEASDDDEDEGKEAEEMKQNEYEKKQMDHLLEKLQHTHRIHEDDEDEEDDDDFIPAQFHPDPSASTSSSSSSHHNRNPTMLPHPSFLCRHCYTVLDPQFVVQSLDQKRSYCSAECAKQGS